MKSVQNGCFDQLECFRMPEMKREAGTDGYWNLMILITYYTSNSKAFWDVKSCRSVGIHQCVRRL